MTKHAIRRYLISDPHWGHKNILNFCNRPENWEEILEKNIKHKVRPQDEIIFLGDVIFSNKQKLIDMLSPLPGRKILVKGNHDYKHSDTWFYNAGFDFVCDTITIKNIVLSHFPIKINENQINIHGHFHNVSPEKWEPFLKERLTNNHYLLSIENVEYEPILITEAEKHPKIKRDLEIISLFLKNKGI